jgi:hypothetical protein
LFLFSFCQTAADHVSSSSSSSNAAPTYDFESQLRAIFDEAREAARKIYAAGPSHDCGCNKAKPSGYISPEISARMQSAGGPKVEAQVLSNQHHEPTATPVLEHIQQHLTVVPEYRNFD